MIRIKAHRVFLTLAMVVALCLISVTPAFAAPGPIPGSESTPAQAVIQKDLQMADGTTTPAATFTFKFTAKSIDDSTAPADLATMPAIADKSVTFASTDAGTTVAGLKSVKRDTASLFAGVVWPHAGVYVYTVTEQSGTYAAGTGETMTYSGGSYDIAVYVANGTSGLYVDAIGSTVVVVDHVGQSVGDKTDPEVSTEVSGASRAMVFTNKYVKNSGGTVVTDPSDQTLAISKAVDGAYGDRTKMFSYDVTVTKSALAPTTTTYKGYVIEGGAVVTAAANGTIAGTDPTNGPYINFPSGTSVTVNLKHGQTLAFIDNEVGSTYVAEEAAVADYTPKVSIVVNGAAPVVTNGTLNTALSTNTRIIGDNENSSAFTNTYKSVTPMGISLNDLPFITMIVLAAGALTAFVVVKSRKRSAASKG